MNEELLLNLNEQAVPKHRNPWYELLDNVKVMVQSPDFLRAFLLTSLSYFSIIVCAVTTRTVYDMQLAGSLTYPMLFVGPLILMLFIGIGSFIVTSLLLLVTWESTKKGNTTLLSDFLNKLIVIMSAYLIIGLVTNITGLGGTIIAPVLYNAISIIVLDGLGQISQAKKEVKLYEEDYDLWRFTYFAY